MPRLQLLSKIVGQETAHDIGGALLHISGGMGIGVQREGRFRVAQDARQGFGVHAGGQCMSRKCVSQIVETDVGQARFSQKFFQLTVGAVRINGSLRAKRMVENPRGKESLLPFPQDLSCAGRQDDFPRSSIGLGVPGHQPTAFFSVESTADLESAALLVKVDPHEGADLAPAQTGGQLGVEEIVPERVCLNGFHERVKLFLVQNVHRLMDNLGRLHLVGGIGGDESLFHGCFERVVEGGMDVVYGSAGEASPLSGAGLYSAIFLQLVVQLSQICRCYLGKRFPPQI